MSNNNKKTKRKMKVKFCDKTLWSKYLATLGIFSSVVTLISFFATAADLGIGVLYIAIPFVALIVVTFLAMWYCANHRNHADLIINNTTVKVCEGDIWSLLDREPAERAGEISVIGVNDYYDVIVDERIVSSGSLHGQYVNKIAQAGKLGQLNTTIENDPFLNGSGNSKMVTSRKAGKQVRYKLGSVVEFESYVLTAFTKFDANNQAWLSAEEYVGFWMRFWENIDKIYAGRTISIPLMGAGITRFKNGKPSKQELLEVMLWTLKISGFHNTCADKQVNFVIYPPDAKEIDFYHIQQNPNFKQRR